MFQEPTQYRWQRNDHMEIRVSRGHNRPVWSPPALGQWFGLSVTRAQPVSPCDMNTTHSTPEEPRHHSVAPLERGRTCSVGFMTRAIGGQHLLKGVPRVCEERAMFYTLMASSSSSGTPPWDHGLRTIVDHVINVLRGAEDHALVCPGRGFRG